MCLYMPYRDFYKLINIIINFRNFWNPIFKRFQKILNFFRKRQRLNMSHIMLRDELTQMTSQKKSVTDFGYPRACRIRKYQFENR
jgi:ribosomal protein L37E